MLLLMTAGRAMAQPTTSAPETQPAASRPGVRSFQPGVSIDWGERTVIVTSHVVLRRGPLEFLACFSGKEHESILRFDAAAMHIYMALGLIGLQPGHPPAWDEARGDFGPAAGDLLDIACAWERDGREQQVDAFGWLREIEYARTPLARPWVFAGSIRLSDGSVAADRSGVGVALVDFSDSLVCLSHSYSSRAPELWVEANSDAIPPVGTRVRVLFRPARPRDYRVAVDFRGQLAVDGRWTAPDDLADLLRLTCKLDPQRVQLIRVEEALRSDVQLVQRRLAECGVPSDAVQFKRESDGPAPTTQPAEGR